MFNNFFFLKIVLCMIQCWKMLWAGEDTDDNIIQGMRFVCCISRGKNTHPEYAIYVAFPRQQSLRERALNLLYGAMHAFFFVCNFLSEHFPLLLISNKFCSIYCRVTQRNERKILITLQ